MFELIFNLLLLIFWIRVLPSARGSVYFNPYIAGMHQASRMPLDIIRKRLPRITQKQGAAMLFVALLGLRTLVLPRSMLFGLEHAFPGAGFPRAFVFSILSFAIMLFYLWLAFVTLAHARGRGDALTEFLAYIARPLPQWRISRRWIAVFILGLSISAALALFAHTADGNMELIQTLPRRLLPRIAVNTAAGMVNLLSVIQSLLIVAVIGSWIVMLAPSDFLGGLCRDAVNLLLGPLREYRLAIGALDLTPLLAILIFGLAHNILLSGLLAPLHRRALIAAIVFFDVFF